MALPSGSLLLQSKSAEQYQLPSRRSRTPSTYSRFTIDSSSHLVGQGDSAEVPVQTSLPTFYPSGSREVMSPSSSNSSGIAFDWRTALTGWRVIVFGSWLNLLLVLIPISWGMTLGMKNTHGLTFALCILGLIPLVRLHDVGTRELANRIGGNRTGLLNGTMSNFVEIIVVISALRKCELRVVQSTLIGSMLSKLLLVLGLCFFAGGMRFSEQGFDATATQIHSSLLSLSVGAVLLPAAYHFALGNESTESTSAELQKQSILKMSHGVSIVLLFIYVAYLLFQFWSHTHLYNDHHNKKSNRLSVAIKEERIHRRYERRKTSTPRIDSRQFELPKLVPSHSNSTLSPPRRPFAPLSPLSSASEIVSLPVSELPPSEKGPYYYNEPSTSTVRLVGQRTSVPMSRETTIGSGFSAATDSTLNSGQDENIEGNEPQSEIPDSPPRKEPQLSWFLTILLLVLVTGAVAVTVDWLVESMDRISTTISKEWIGLILLPGISSIAECLTAVRVSVKDELSLSVSVAIGSTLQTALLVTPFTIILAWITDKPLSLLMDPFQSMVLYIAVHTVGYVVADGKSNWLEGLVLVCLYIIIAVSFWFYPGSDFPSSLAACTAS